MQLKIRKAQDTMENASRYSLASYENTYFLGYRDIPSLLQKYAQGNKAMDYGCGTGRSTRFLQSQGLETIGVDISKHMLKEALKNDPSSHYLHIKKSARIPVFSESCDVVFSCFVLFLLSSKKDLLSLFKEIYRCLKPGGIFLFVTGSENLYTHNWVSYQTDFPENKNLKKGGKARIYLKDLQIEYTNYLWLDEDYNELAKTSDLKILEKHSPLGNPDEPYPWISETTYSPYSIYIMQK